MKYLILATTLVATSTCSLIAMEDTYKEMIDRISNKAIGNPSITLVNNSKISLWMEIGNLEKDNIRTRMYLPKDVALTFSPYTEPFCLKEQYSKAGALIDLYTKRPEDDKNNGHKQLLIGGISEIKFGGMVYISHNDDTNTLKFTHFNKPSKKVNTLKTIKRHSTK